MVFCSREVERNLQNVTVFKMEKRGYLLRFCSDKDWKGTVVNLASHLKLRQQFYYLQVQVPGVARGILKIIWGKSLFSPSIIPPR